MSRRRKHFDTHRLATLIAFFGLVAPPLVASAQDGDGDGIADGADYFPCDPQLSAVAFSPGEGVQGTLLFEDNWPSQGDLDFNDVVLSYNYALELNASGQVGRMTATFDVVAIGGSFNSGLGMVLPVSRAAARRVTLRVGAESPRQLTPASDSQLTLIIASNARDLLGGGAGPINARPDSPRREGVRVTLEILFTAGASIAASGAPYDVFIFRTDDPSHEIHRPEFDGTDAMAEALFGSADDGSSSTRHFVDGDGLPFALAFPNIVEYPGEAVVVSALYPRIVQFAASGGAEARDFYETEIDATARYRDVGGQGRFVPPEPEATPRGGTCGARFFESVANAHQMFGGSYVLRGLLGTQQDRVPLSGGSFRMRSGVVLNR